MECYWLQICGLEWQKATLDQFTQAERAAGFYSKAGHGKLATAGFSNGTIAGKITYEDVTEENTGKE